jgi:hypothetical protein
MMDIRQLITHDVSHRHGRSCYWDHRRAGWACPSSGLSPTPVVVADREDCTDPSTTA